MFYVYETFMANMNISALVTDRILTPGTEYDVTIMMDTIGYTIPEGDSVMVMAAPGSFPLTWPGPAPCTLTITSGRIMLPTFTDLKEEEASELFARPDLVPRLGPCKELEIIREEAFSRDLSFSLSGAERTITMKMDEGCKYYPDVDTEIDEVNEDVYSISGDDPLSASAVCRRSCKIIYQVRKIKMLVIPIHNELTKARSGSPIVTTTTTESAMRANKEDFLLENQLTNTLDGEIFFEKVWNDTVPRNGV